MPQSPHFHGLLGPRPSLRHLLRLRLRAGGLPLLVLRFLGAPRLRGRWSAWGSGLQRVSGVPTRAHPARAPRPQWGLPCGPPASNRLLPSLARPWTPPSGLGFLPTWSSGSGTRSASIPACRAAASISHLCYGKSRGGEAGEREGRKEKGNSGEPNWSVGLGKRGLPGRAVYPTPGSDGVWGHLVRLFNRTVDRIPGHNSPKPGAPPYPPGAAASL